MKFVAIQIILILMFSRITLSAAEKPEWCRQLPRPEYKKLERIEVSDPWFEVYRVAPGVFAIYEPHQFQEVISYLITGEKSALLFDSGMGISRIRPVVEQLTKLPVRVLNSHTHPDHVGGNFEFQNIFGEDTSYTKKNSAGYSPGDLKDWAKGDNVCGAVPKNFDADAYHISGFKISQFVRDGQVIDLGKRRLKVIFTPGHTPDSLCLFDQDNGLLFSGDVFYPGPIYLFSPETDFAAYTKSVQHLNAMRTGIRLLLPAHNVPVAPPEVLAELNQAVFAIQKGNARYTEHDRLRDYQFKSFSILLRR